MQVTACKKKLPSKQLKSMIAYIFIRQYFYGRTTFLNEGSAQSRLLWEFDITRLIIDVNIDTILVSNNDSTVLKNFEAKIFVNL